MSNLVKTHLFIDGREQQTVQQLTVTDPAKPEMIIGYAAAASTNDVDRTIESAKRALPAWSTLTPQERQSQMAAALVGIAENRDKDAEILSQEIGKIRHEGWIDSLVFEMRWNLALSHVAEIDKSTILPPVPDHIPTETTVTYQPLGVVTIIIPFNWPAAILGASLPQALIAGNTVIVKVPPTAPLGVSRIVQRIAAQLPAGVLNIISGHDEDMKSLITDTRIAKVCFTGSVKGGKSIMSLASQNLTRLTLELGGNDPAIILEDATLDDMQFDRLFSAIFDTTGQICMNVKRLLVHHTRLDEVVDGLSRRLQSTILGHGLDDKTTMGPLHTLSQKNFINELLSEAVESGASVLQFGTIPDGDLQDGNFVLPALIINPDPSLRIVTEEQFGPIIPITSFESEAEAIVHANNTWAGLGGSVWTTNQESADRIARQLTCGYVWINDHGAPRLDLRAPFGGMKQSGFGREQGLEGIRAFQDTRAIARIPV